MTKRSSVDLYAYMVSRKMRLTVQVVKDDNLYCLKDDQGMDLTHWQTLGDFYSTLIGINRVLEYIQKNKEIGVLA